MAAEKKSRKQGKGRGRKPPRERRPVATGPHPGVTSLVAASPPASSPHELPPDQVEFYVRAAIHQDRKPGNVLAIFHPGRAHRFPRGLLEALEAEDFVVTRQETDGDRVKSVEGIRDALQRLAGEGRPIDVLVVSGDGTLDHHVLVAAFWAFYPDLVRYRPGSIDCSAVGKEDLARIPEPYRTAFFEELPAGHVIDATEECIKEIWLLRSRVERLIRKGKPPARIVRRVRRRQEDPLLRIAVLATLLPHKVVLRPHGFDLSGLVDASQERTFQGLYPFIRSICTYPAGTAADNAVFAGVPGWGYGFTAGFITRFRVLGPLRRVLERRLVRAFLRYFLRDSVVVPARISLIDFDGAWQRVNSHAAGGPAAGRFFSADLTSKTRGLMGYLKRTPKVVLQEGFFGSTIVRIRSLFSSGEQKSFTEAQIAEAFYTNRTFIAGVGSVPTTNPTSMAGQSSLLLLPPIWYRGKGGRRLLNVRGIGTFAEAILKGTLARLLHGFGLGVGTFGGGGKIASLLPEHQVAIKEGEKIEIEYLTMDHQPRAVPVQVSGDPFQAWRMSICMHWGPVPLLGRHDSLLLAAIRRSLADLRLQQSYRMGRVYIGGLRYFRHHIGEDWTRAFEARTGLLQPPNHLPRNLPLAQRMLLEAWQASGAGEFVDTTESGLAMWRRGRYAHNNDQSAHLLVLREPQGTLLVRQVRAMGEGGEEIFESRTHYRAVGASYILYRNQTVIWSGNGNPRILQEEHFFRSAEAFQQEAPTFFPVVAHSPQEPILLPHEGDDLSTDEANEPDPAREDAQPSRPEA